MPIQHTRPNRTGILPTIANTSNATANWMKQERQPFVDTPAVTTFTNSLALPAGTPGGSVIATFQPVPIIYDRYNMVGQAASTTIRIPWDGIYDIDMEFQYHDPNQAFEILGQLQLAPTSDSGFAVPVFSNLLDPTGNVYEMWAQQTAVLRFQPRYNNILRGIELHANDLLRMTVQQYAAAGPGNCWFNFFDVRWCCPIPNNQINI